MTSMYLVAGFAAAYSLTRWLRRDQVFFWQVFPLLVAACELVGLVDREIPLVMYAGNLAFGVLLVLAAVVEALLWRRGPARTDIRYGVAALAAMVWPW